MEETFYAHAVCAAQAYNDIWGQFSVQPLHRTPDILTIANATQLSPFFQTYVASSRAENMIPPTISVHTSQSRELPLDPGFQNSDKAMTIQFLCSRFNFTILNARKHS